MIYDMVNGTCPLNITSYDSFLGICSPNRMGEGMGFIHFSEAIIIFIMALICMFIFFYVADLIKKRRVKISKE